MVSSRPAPHRRDLTDRPTDRGTGKWDLKLFVAPAIDALGREKPEPTREELDRRGAAEEEEGRISHFTASIKEAQEGPLRQ